MGKRSVVHTSVRAAQRVTKMSSSNGVDATQASYLTERCILVDQGDKMVGCASKRECHQWKGIQTGGCLHRAFSVFVFNSSNELLLQQRSLAKITFPGLWTNTCCSHPLAQVEENGVDGVKAAAIRKLDHELGIPTSTVVQFSPSDLHFVTRIEYSAPMAGSEWGEHEVDYIIITRCRQPLKLDAVNDNEVMATRYVNRQQLQHMLDEHKSGTPVFTPWFLLITQNGLLDSWWNSLDDLEKVADRDTIHRYGTFSSKDAE